MTAIRWLTRAALALVVSFGAILVGVGLWLGGTVTALGGRERVAGIGDSVVVLWDSLAVPHIIARSDSDLFFALGYLHARDRLWQMELERHAAEGRLSELFGSRFVGTDRSLRTLEMTRIARVAAAKNWPGIVPTGNAYARGVNAWIARGRLPPELVLLRHRPEPWSPVNSYEVGLLQAWDLHSDGRELAQAQAVRRLGAAKAADLVPVYPDSAPTILPQEREGHPHASNSWVLGPGRTRSHKPILANDPHLTLRAPSVWYLVGAHAPGYTAVGVTVPGAPVVVLGHTAAIAWGFTNGMVDDVDYVIEQLDADSTHSRTPTGWAPLEVVTETLSVRGARPVIYTRRRTIHGPLVDAAWMPDSGRALAMRWVAQDPVDVLGALLAMARATDRASFARAIETFRSPEQNVIYGDTAGNIAYWLAANVPIRRGGRDGTLPVPGWKEAASWTRYLSSAELPHFTNPADGFIVTANNKIVGPRFPFYIGNDWELPYRAQRIREMVSRDSAATAASVAREQLDRVDVFARAMSSLAATSAERDGRPDLGQSLRRWGRGGEMSADRTEPTLFWSWYRELQTLVFGSGYRPAYPLHRWLFEGHSPWFGGAVGPLAQQAMDSVLARGIVRSWGDVHSVIQEHALGGLVPLRLLLRLNVGPVPSGGDAYSVNVCHSEEMAPPFTCTDGPSMRHVVDLGDVDGEGGFIIPTGQSGNPLSSHYRDQLERWRQGRLWVVPIDVRKIHAVDTLRLVP